MRHVAELLTEKPRFGARVVYIAPKVDEALLGSSALGLPSGVDNQVVGGTEYTDDVNWRLQVCTSSLTSIRVG